MQMEKEDVILYVNVAKFCVSERLIFSEMTTTHFHIFVCQIVQPDQGTRLELVMVSSIQVLETNMQAIARGGEEQFSGAASQVVSDFVERIRDGIRGEEIYFSYGSNFNVIIDIECE